MITVTINGIQKEFKENTALVTVLKQCFKNTNRLAVEYNSELVTAEKWDTIILKNKDILEIVSFVGGG